MKDAIWKLIAINIILIILFVPAIKTDKPCLPRHYPGNSVVCVCNSTYCDTITRISPCTNQYVSYTSSLAGTRFMKTIGTFKKTTNYTCPLTLVLDPDVRFQTIKGFGGAITDAAAINWRSLPTPQLKQYFIDSYFSDTGIQYSIVRTPIGGSDFSEHKYAYNEWPRNDVFLSNFSLTHEDLYYKIPMIKAAFAASKIPIYILGTTWAPPAWMTDASNYTTCGRLKKKYYSTLADYHIKFLEHYEEQGVPVWGISTTNEPSIGFLPLKKFNCLTWTAYQMGLWITGHLGPKIRNSKFKDIKILGVDDQRHTIPLWFFEMLKEHPYAIEYLDGIGIHGYSNFFTPPEQLALITNTHPDKFILATEFCEGSFPWEDKKVDLGSWDRAKTYISDIITDLCFEAVGWLDWNICLNEEGGPAWNGNYVDSPVIVSAEKGEFYKQPMFYALGHVSKFIPRGSRRINSTVVKCDNTKEPNNIGVWHKKEIVEHVAVVTPTNTIVVVLYNNGPSTAVGIQLCGKHASVKMEANAIVTVEFLNN